MRAVVACALTAAALAGPAAGANAVQVENALPGSTHWHLTSVSGGAIEAYASEVSVLPGETVHLHVSTDPPALYHVHVFRLGWYGGLGAREVACVPTTCNHVSSGTTFTRPSDGYLGARWPVTDELRIGDDWVSGYYLAHVELRSGEQDGRSAPVFFFVRPPPARRSAIVVQAPVNTWQAYNPWGGKSLYDSLSEGGRSTRVSFERPIPPNHLQPWEWEIQLVRFLEREGYDVSYQTDVDTHRDPASLLTHRTVVVNGHDEYWTSTIRDAFDNARDAGTNLAFVGANIGYWQVRYEDGEKTVVGYKSSADPITDPRLQTVQFRQLNPPRPECQLLGVQYEEGKKSFGDPPRDYAVNPAALDDEWFASTGFTAATVLPELVSPEWDTLTDACRKPGLTTFFQYQGAPAGSHVVRYTAPSGARVFSAGSLDFAWGLDTWIAPTRGLPYSAIPGLQQFMRNALADLTRPARVLGVSTSTSQAGVTLRIDRGPDPRIGSTVVTRGGTVVCDGPSTVCVDRTAPGHRTHLYELVNVDEWGRSLPRVVRVRVPNTRPSVSLRAPPRPRAGRVVVVADASDRDGDRLRFRWTVDGRAAGARGRLLATRLSRGVHVVAVEVTDGHGGRSRARATLRVR